MAVKWKLAYSPLFGVVPRWIVISPKGRIITAFNAATPADAMTFFCINLQTLKLADA